jgi:hypothetical protein
MRPDFAMLPWRRLRQQRLDPEMGFVALVLSPDRAGYRYRRYVAGWIGVAEARPTSLKKTWAGAVGGSGEPYLGGRFVVFAPNKADPALTLKWDPVAAAAVRPSLPNSAISLTPR